MSDDVGTTTPAAPAAPQDHAAPEAPSRPRRVVLTVLPFVLVLGAVGGAGAYTLHAVNGADRTVATVAWDDKGPKPSPDPAVNAGRGRADTELSKLLMPVPKGYRLGPDIDELGNDSETSGEEATAVMKEMGRGLAGKERRQFDEAIDRFLIEGVAQRSYTSDGGARVLTVHVAKLKDARAARTLYERQKRLTESAGMLRKGPTIAGHKNVTCYQPDWKSEVPLHSMFCQAHEGGVLVMVEANGSTPFGAQRVAGLVKDQLDHIKSPGESI
ncbi:hypothetical protein [Streptomyces sp. NPDC007346]|uniref:hypothetical protein n=1 Tax=Streptomyces sp. NPDC007346 TaxID=3154682 RepID=UPI003453C8B2